MATTLERNTTLAERFRDTRGRFLSICEPLLPDDFNLQAAPFASPPKWHLAHSSWFFETFLLKAFQRNYVCTEPRYEILFNSYYNGVGEQFPRAQRGLLSRPSLDQVLAYRAGVDTAMEQLLAEEDHPDADQIVERTRLGIEHEKQHQELFFTDLKFSLAVNPLNPSYRSEPVTAEPSDPAMNWQEYAGGMTEIGRVADDVDFAFDNESPRHQVYLQPFAIADRLVTNAQFQEFVDDRGYSRPELWLADGWNATQTEGWQHPLYWRENDGAAMEYTLRGLVPRQPEQPVCHISAYEADAYARWANARLPLEQEWEHAASGSPLAQRADHSPHPQPAAAGPGLRQLYSDCWQWTGSAYRPYPGYRPAAGAIGEYNGKFMCNQWVLRGGSCATPGGHLRPSYRNFFYPGDRWQFSGLRLARDLP